MSDSEKQDYQCDECDEPATVAATVRDEFVREMVLCDAHLREKRNDDSVHAVERNEVMTRTVQGANESRSLTDFGGK